MPERILIVGASLAGATAAITLRRRGFDGEVTLVGEEARPPYERPPLSKAYLRGETTAEDALVRPAAYYADHGIELLLDMRAGSLDIDRRIVHVADGRELPYDALLIATGARNRRPPIPGLELQGVIDLRTVDDCDRLRDLARPGSRVVVAGTGFLGSEVAASLTQLDASVTAIGSTAPLAGVLGDEIGRTLADVHRAHGVALVLGDRLASIEGDGRAERVVTAGGRRVEADVVVTALGVEPAVDLAAGTPIEVRDGIVVDELCRTNVPGVYACGDVANHLHPVYGRHVRIEHWQHARRHARAAASSMLGEERPYDEVYWFWSDQYEHTIEYAGYHAGWDQLAIRGSVEARRFSGYYLIDHRLQAAVSFDRAEDVRAVTPLLASRAPVDANALRDESRPLPSP
jgi:3-phenylpropionate/trans-cinnamate dioxygenase ferredoxin reductase component